MADGLPRRLLLERDERNGDVGELEEGDGVHVADLLRRGGCVLQRRSWLVQRFY